ncbi:MAG: carbonic anhydrase [Leptospirales bacterium]
MNVLDTILAKNKAWAQGQKEVKLDYFTEISKAQYPEILWVGCCDSRVSPSNITAAKPGEIFELRNIANQVKSGDPGLNAAMHFAINTLKVQHLFVTGHYECGGIISVVEEGGLPKEMEPWLSPVVKYSEEYKDLLARLPSIKEKSQALIKINVIEQVRNFTLTNAVKKKWNEGSKLHVHGLVFNMYTGLLESLDVCSSSFAEVEQKCEAAIKKIIG